MKRVSLISKLLVIVLSAGAMSAFASDTGQARQVTWSFSERTGSVGLEYLHFYPEPDPPERPRENHEISGGLAIGDLNNDGWDDIFAVTGYSNDMEGNNPNPNVLFISDKAGGYMESASTWGLSEMDRYSAGPLIADVNGDGRNDLLLGGVEDDSVTNIRLYLNTGSSFSDATVSSGLHTLLGDAWNFGMAAADINRDGDLDLFVGHWFYSNYPLLLENNGSGGFSDITNTHMDGVRPIHIFTPTFADLNNDGWLDLLLSNDFLNDDSGNGGSRYFLNDGAGSFEQEGLPIPTADDPNDGPDENGMGSAIADYDNDGDMDWFVSSIYDTDGSSEGNWGVTGNRLYKNNGSGQFSDATDDAMVRVGFWGWGSCFADFNNDMHLDLYHVNGFHSGRNGENEFENDPARMFINNGNDIYTEQSTLLGVDDTGQGRAILCFDSDHDGDLDILVNNNQGYSVFFQNDLSNGNNWVVLKLQQDVSNHEAIGAKVAVTAGGITQTHQVFAGGNFESSHPTAQHFGLAGNSTITSIAVTWPDGEQQFFPGLAVNQYHILTKATDVVMKDGFE